MKKVTTKSGRVYLIDQSKRVFMRCGEGEIAGVAWFKNNEWTRYSRTSEIEVGRRLYIVQNGSYADSDLFMISSTIALIEDVERDE